MPAPKVTTSVIDQTTRVSSQGTYNSAIVVAAKKGPVNKPIKVTNQTAFLRLYTPDGVIPYGSDTSLYEAYTYLGMQSNLYVVRAAHLTDDPLDSEDYVALYGGCVIKNATSANSNISLAEGLTDPDLYGQDAASDDVMLIYGSSQGAFANKVDIEIITDQTQVKLAGAFIINVYYNNKPVETHICSLDPSLKDGYGVNCFVQTVLTGSNYIRAISYVELPGQNGYPLPKAQSRTPNKLYLAGGSDGTDVVPGDRIKALQELQNINDINIQLILDGGETNEGYLSEINRICEIREDSCHGIISTPMDAELGRITGDSITDLTTWRTTTLNANTANLELYTPHQKIYDEFNDRELYISPAPFVAALIMKYAQELGWHWAVAGYNRGIVNSLDVAKTFTPGEVDELSDVQINTIIKDPGYGNVIWDELTQLAQAKDMQDAHISRYINIYLRPRLKESLKTFLFEFNDEQTRMLITKMIDTFMESQKASRACYDYMTVCDETNNLPIDIQNNVLNCWLYLKPTKIAKWIKQQIIITPYGTSLESLS